VGQDPAGNIKPDKERSRKRIDGISALVNALGRALLRDATGGRSVYETRGLLAF
jgi:phage terminase large subunit-like protein